jgi:hypothetical protein
VFPGKKQPRNNLTQQELGFEEVVEGFEAGTLRAGGVEAVLEGIEVAFGSATAVAGDD